MLIDMMGSISFCISQHMHKAFRLSLFSNAPFRALPISTPSYQLTSPPSRAFPLNVFRRFKFSRSALAKRSSFWAAKSTFFAVPSGGALAEFFIMSHTHMIVVWNEANLSNLSSSFGKVLWRSFHPTQTGKRLLIAAQQLKKRSHADLLLATKLLRNGEYRI